MTEATEKPKCPAHPNGSVLRTNVAATNRSVWVCPACGKRLGDAGPRVEPTKEEFTL